MLAPCDEGFQVFRDKDMAMDLLEACLTNEDWPTDEEGDGVEWEYLMTDGYYMAQAVLGRDGLDRLMREEVERRQLLTAEGSE